MVLHVLIIVLLVVMRQPVFRQQEERFLADVRTSHSHDHTDVLLVGVQSGADRNSSPGDARLRRYLLRGNSLKT